MTVIDMFAKYMLAAFLGAMAFSVSAYEAECPDNAIDAIEDEDRYSHCTYDDSGLNGRLNNFFDKQNNPSKTQRESEAVSVYDNGESAEVKTELVVEEELSASPVVVAESVDTPVRAIYNIRESFGLSNGPGNAINGLYRQMAKYCPAGWEKLAEWAEPNGKHYYIHYQFQCAN